MFASVAANTPVKPAGKPKRHMKAPSWSLGWEGEQRQEEFRIRSMCHRRAVSVSPSSWAALARWPSVFFKA